MSADWAREVDLAVIGFGAAGAATALTASKLGARVLLAEKQDAGRHTPNSKMSRGLIMTVNDVEEGTKYLSHCAGGMVPRAPLQALAERSSRLISWLNENCPRLPFTRVTGAEHPHIAGANSIDVYQPGYAKFKRDPEAGTGRDFFRALQAAVDTTDVEVWWRSPAKRLIRDGNGGIAGVVLATDKGPQNIRVRHGVVLTCGGFEYDDAAKLNYLRAYPMYFYGNPDNTGDGLRMAQEVGADLWHMNQMVGRAIGNFRTSEGSTIAFQLSIDPPGRDTFEPAGYVITDRFGNRFANEKVQAALMHSFYYDLLQFDSDRGLYPRIPCYWFFDERRRVLGPLSSPFVGACAVGLYDWSPDNSKEITSGWISKGETLEEAARCAGVVDWKRAAQTVESYNEICRAGTGDPLGRPSATLVPIDQGPFYCVELWPGGSNTTGGPRRDETARVLNALGEPIGGLYAAGELGQVSGLLYPADGANLCEALCYGQIAAESALSYAARRSSNL